MLVVTIVGFNNLSSLFADKNKGSSCSICYNIQYSKLVLTDKWYFHCHGNINMLDKHTGKDWLNAINKKNNLIYMHHAFTFGMCTRDLSEGAMDAWAMHLAPANW